MPEWLLYMALIGAGAIGGVLGMGLYLLSAFDL